MSFIVGLDHVTIQIDEGDEALRNALQFYVEILGLEPLDRPANTDNGRPGHGCDAARSSSISSLAPERRRRIGFHGAIRRFGSRT